MAKTKEQVYREQMIELGIYQEIFEPEIKTLAQIEREYTRAKKAWSATAQPKGSAPSVLDPHYTVVRQLRAEILQHREALGLTPKALQKLTGTHAGNAAPEVKDLITQKLDRIAASVASYDDLPAAQDAAEISALMDDEDHPGSDDYDLAAAVAEDMG